MREDSVQNIGFGIGPENPVLVKLSSKLQMYFHQISAAKQMSLRLL